MLIICLHHCMDAGKEVNSCGFDMSDNLSWSCFLKKETTVSTNWVSTETWPEMLLALASNSYCSPSACILVLQRCSALLYGCIVLDAR